MARGVAIAALAAMAVLSSVYAKPTTLRMRALNQSAAVINMTDDITYGTFSWTGAQRFAFDDDVTISGSLTAAKIMNKKLQAATTKINNIVDCNKDMKLYDSKSDTCMKVTSSRHNMRVREVVDGCSYMYCFIMWDYQLRCWGYAGGYGQLGYGDTNNFYMPLESPATYNIKLQSRRIDDGRSRMYPAAHTYHNMGAVLNDGTVWMVGYAGYGNNGEGTTSSRNYWVKSTTLTNVTAIVGGGHSTESMYCAITGSNNLYCWGYNNAGQVGVGTTSATSNPTKVNIEDVKMMDISKASTSSSCAVKWDGTVYCWGYNGYGQLANGGTGNRNTPGQVGSSVTLYLEDIVYLKMHGGSVVTPMALRKDGTLWAWGYNGNGQTGTGGTTNRKRAFQVIDSANSPLTNVRDTFPCNGAHEGANCALKHDGTVWCWGRNNRGQLGLGHTSDRDRAYHVSGLTEEIDTMTNPPSISHSYGYHTMCAVTKFTRQVWCWGFNNYGQIGDGTTSQRNSPVRTLNVGRTAFMGSRMYHMSSGDTTFYAVSEDGYTVWAWGYGGHGQPGCNTYTIGGNYIASKSRLT